MILKKCIEQLMNHQNLDKAMCQEAIDDIMAPGTNPLQIAAFLVLLRAKPETPQELAAIVTALRKKMIPVQTRYKVLDIVGTGGDGMQTINISTGSAILAASCGVKIAKHGNRSVSSLTGSADVLEALGVDINLPPNKISECIDNLGIGFCFSPNFHPAMRKLRALRKKMHVPTTFNLLGPLLNPAKASYYVMGVLNENLIPVIAETLKLLHVDRAVVAHGSGLDEISCVGPTKLIEITPQHSKEIILNPIDLGFSNCTVADLRGGKAKENAKILLDVFKGKKGAIADTFILNAAVALWIYGIHSSIEEALPHAKENLFNGSAFKLLQKWVAYSHEVSI